MELSISTAWNTACKIKNTQLEIVNNRNRKTPDFSSGTKNDSRHCTCRRWNNRYMKCKVKKLLKTQRRFKKRGVGGSDSRDSNSREQRLTSSLANNRWMSIRKLKTKHNPVPPTETQTQTTCTFCHTLTLIKTKQHTSTMKHVSCQFTPDSLLKMQY